MSRVNVAYLSDTLILQTAVSELYEINVSKREFDYCFQQENLTDQDLKKNIVNIYFYMNLFHCTLFLLENLFKRSLAFISLLHPSPWLYSQYDGLIYRIKEEDIRYKVVTSKMSRVDWSSNLSCTARLSP